MHRKNNNEKENKEIGVSKTNNERKVKNSLESSAVLSFFSWNRLEPNVLGFVLVFALIVRAHQICVRVLKKSVRACAFRVRNLKDLYGALRFVKPGL